MLLLKVHLLLNYGSTPAGYARVHYAFLQPLRAKVARQILPLRSCARLSLFPIQKYCLALELVRAHPSPAIDNETTHAETSGQFLSRLIFYFAFLQISGNYSSERYWRA